MRVSAAICAFVLLLGSAPAAATEAPSPLQIRQFLAEYGTCIARREPDLARKAVVSGASFSSDSVEGKRLKQRECMDEDLLTNTVDGFKGRLRMRLDEDTYRGVIAEALIVGGSVVLPQGDLTAIPLLTYSEPWPLRTIDRDGKPISEEKLARARAAIARKTEAMLMGKLGECVVRKAPAESRAVLGTGLETPAELQALNALGPTLSQCIKAGETVALDRISVRGAVAIAYYRLAHAATSPTSAGAS